MSTSQSIIKGRQGRNSNREGSWRQELTEAMEESCLLACSFCFLIELRAMSPGTAPPMMCWALIHQSLIKKMPYNQILWRHFLNGVFLVLCTHFGQVSLSRLTVSGVWYTDSHLTNTVSRYFRQKRGKIIASGNII